MPSVLFSYSYRHPSLSFRFKAARSARHDAVACAVGMICVQSIRCGRGDTLKQVENETDDIVEELGKSVRILRCDENVRFCNESNENLRNLMKLYGRWCQATLP